MFSSYVHPDIPSMDMHDFNYVAPRSVDSLASIDAFVLLKDVLSVHMPSVNGRVLSVRSVKFSGAVSCVFFNVHGSDQELFVSLSLLSDELHVDVTWSKDSDKDVDQCAHVDAFRLHAPVDLMQLPGYARAVHCISEQRQSDDELIESLEFAAHDDAVRSPVIPTHRYTISSVRAANSRRECLGSDAGADEPASASWGRSQDYDAEPYHEGLGRLPFGDGGW